MSPIWEWIVGAIARLLLGLKLAAAGIVGRVLATFGLSLVTFNAVLPNFQSFIQSQAGGLSGEALNFLGAIGLGQAMSMVLSALTIRMAWRVFLVPTSVANAIGGGS